MEYGEFQDVYDYLKMNAYPKDCGGKNKKRALRKKALQFCIQGTF